MEKLTALKWAMLANISEEDYNGYLAELGYQEKGARDYVHTAWTLTEEGEKHGEYGDDAFSKEILWDLESHREVIKLCGIKTGMYKCCANCKEHYHIDRLQIDEETGKWVCEKCETVNELDSE